MLSDVHLIAALAPSEELDRTFSRAVARKSDLTFLLSSDRDEYVLKALLSEIIHSDSSRVIELYPALLYEADVIKDCLLRNPELRNR